MSYGYIIQDGESIAVCGDGSVVVAHPERPPKLLEFDKQGRATISEIEFVEIEVEGE